MQVHVETTNPFSLMGKRALVTGGAMGIGMGIVKRFVDSGAKVLVADKVIGPVEKYISSLPESNRRSVSVMDVDLLDVEAPDLMLSEMVKDFGGIDILVNNAGIYPTVPMLDMSPEQFDKVYHLNLRALAFTSKAAAKQMIKQKTNGKIVNIASIDSIHPSSIGLAAYDASKGGVLMFTKNFALEVAKSGITVNAIAPGGIATEGTGMSGSGNPASEEIRRMLEDFKKQIPMGRMGTPDDIAKVAVFLASSASDYMTGSLVVVDGGRLLM